MPTLDYRQLYNDKCDELGKLRVELADLKESNNRYVINTNQLTAKLQQVRDELKETRDLYGCWKPDFAGPVPTSGEILRLYTESCLDKACSTQQHLWEAYTLALDREQTAGKVEDYMGKEGAEKLAEQVAGLVREKLAVKEPDSDNSKPRLELTWEEDPVRLAPSDLSKGDIYLDRLNQICIWAPAESNSSNSCWFGKRGIVGCAREQAKTVTVIGHLKAVYPIEEIK